MSEYMSGTDSERKTMLAKMDYQAMDQLFHDVPTKVRLNRDLELPMPLSEMELARHMKALANRNVTTGEYSCFLGAGAYDHYIPSAVDHVISRSEFYTAYTPYQPEVSQGTLQAIFEYQTMVCELTGMDVANASVYDGATAIAEAANMACRIIRKREIIISRTVNPQYRKTLHTYARFNGQRVVETDYQGGATDIAALESKINSETAAIVIQNPNFFGAIENVKEIAALAAKNNILLITSVDPISLGVLKPPGEMGADIVVGEGQSMGNSLSFGGPYLGFFAAKGKYLRQMPGRIVGQTVDGKGNTGFVLTMQTREQHIRREKATSNICSNQALNALAATVYLTLMGKQGLREVASLCLQKSHYAYKRLTDNEAFTSCFPQPFFKEFTVKSRYPLNELNHKLLADEIIGGYDLGRDYPELENCWLLAVTEKRSREEIDRLVKKAVEKI